MNQNPNTVTEYPNPFIVNRVFCFSQYNNIRDKQ